MSKSMDSTSWIDYLNDPNLVARFQEACGIKRIPIVITTSLEKSKLTTETLCHHHHHYVAESDKNETLFLTQKNNDLTNSSIHSSHSSSTSGIETNRTSSITESHGSSSNESTDDSDESAFITTTTDYIIQNKLWYYLAKFGGAMGDEVFYACFFPFWFWNIDGAVCRRVVLFWAIFMYIGQGLKDIIRWPRPSSPPVVRLEKKWEMEYGMPSTHAIVASAVPFSVLFFTSSRYQYEFTYGLTIAIVWCFIVSISRIYLGMHSVLDVVAGLSLVGFLFPWMSSLADWLDPILLKHQYGGLYLLLGGIILVVLTPAGDKWTPARGDTVTIIGTACGLIMGAWMNYQLGIIRGPALDPPYPVLWPTNGMLGLSLLRLVIGLVIIFATRAIVKSTAIIILGEQLFKRSIKSITYRPFPPKKEIFIDLSYKFIMYMSLGFNVVFLCPIVFRLIGIERPTFHTEI